MLRLWRGIKISTTIMCWIGVCMFIIASYNNVHISSPVDNPNSTASAKETSFLGRLQRFPWLEFEAAYNTGDIDQTQHFSGILLQTLIPFLAKSPLVPVNSSCQPPILSVPPKLSCKVLEQPRKIGVLLQLGFDLDALEIHLHELDEVADKFFLIESVRPHSGFVNDKHKPLMWEMAKRDERFAPFLQKVVHFVLDDAHPSNGSIGKKSDQWWMEISQETLRWEKFLQWNEHMKFFSDSDFLGFGDADEVPHRDNIYYLKHCQVDGQQIDIGTWFPWTRLDNIFKSDWPIKGNPFAWGDPTYWTLGWAKKYASGEVEGNRKPHQRQPTRMRGRSPNHLLGGMHISLYAYPPMMFAKVLTRTSATKFYIKRMIDGGKYFTKGQFVDAEQAIYNSGRYSKRIVSLENFRSGWKSNADAIVKLPWFLNCNRKRYPAFDGEHDSRLD